MNDQLLTDLRAAGFDVRPTAILDKDGAFFALTEDQLIYLDAQGAASVELRDVTRIHSDQTGILRVETGHTTAVTAPLLGYEPARVQHFFGEVRHATARAKSLPPSPLPAESGSPWKTGWSGANSPSSVTVLRPGAAPVPAAPPAEPMSAEPMPAGAEPAEAQDTETPVSGTSAPAPEFTSPEPTPPEPTLSEPTEPEPIRIGGAPGVQRPAGERRPVQGAPAPASTPARQGTPSPLAQFAPTLRILAVLMGLTGVGVGALEWRAGAPLSGLWLIGVGAVGAFALYVFAEVVRAVADIQAHLSQNR